MITHAWRDAPEQQRAVEHRLIGRSTKVVQERGAPHVENKLRQRRQITWQHHAVVVPCEATKLSMYASVRQSTACVFKSGVIFR